MSFGEKRLVSGGNDVKTANAINELTHFFLDLFCIYEYATLISSVSSFLNKKKSFSSLKVKSLMVSNLPIVKI